jgi:hypothetical protein
MASVHAVFALFAVQFDVQVSDAVMASPGLTGHDDSPAGVQPLVRMNSFCGNTSVQAR